jgi:hypothetical protein
LPKPQSDRDTKKDKQRHAQRSWKDDYVSGIQQQRRARDDDEDSFYPEQTVHALDYMRKERAESTPT